MFPSGVKVDLLFASSDIEAEIVDRATPIDFEGAGLVPVANAEELLVMKVLSMTDTRLQDRIDAQHLLQFTPSFDISSVREHLAQLPIEATPANKSSSKARGRPARRRIPEALGRSRIPRNHSTKENRRIEAFSIQRFSGCAGAQRGLYTAISLRFERRLVA